MAPRVAIIGAGPLGLMALKNMLEDGLDVTAYEARSWVGGLWNHSDDDRISVAEFTVFNSSRYRSAISDYPFPDDTDDFPTWQQMHAYFNGYADHFDLRKRIRFNSPVSGLERRDGQWLVEVKSKDGGALRDTYDKVLVATGSFVQPKHPSIKGIEKFAGRVLHSIDFHDGSQFKGQNVLLIGLHASAVDVARSLDNGQAKHVYAAHRNGVLLVPKFTSQGVAFDANVGMGFFFFQLFAQTWFPGLFNWLINKVLYNISKKAYGEMPASWKLLPAPSIATSPPLLGDELWPLLKRGLVEPCDAVDELIGSKTVRLTDGRILTDIDAIVYCTGYHIVAPCVPKEWNPYARPGEVPYLYRGCFSLHSDAGVRGSLAFLGHGAAVFPGFVSWEMSGMAVSQVWKGNSKLPSYEQQKKWYTGYITWRRRQEATMKKEGTFFTAFLPFSDHMYWLDDAAGTDVLKSFGWFSLRAWRLWWNDKKLYNLMKTGVFSPAIWRLFDGGKRKAWAGARTQIFSDNEIFKRRSEKKLKEMQAEQQSEEKTN